MTRSILDDAHAATLADPDDVDARLRFYARLTEAELFLLLEDEAEGDHMRPRVFPVEDGPMVLAFDSEARLAEFTGLPAPYAALPGRVLLAMLAQADQPLTLGLNLGVAPSSRVLPPEVLGWLEGILANTPQELQARPRLLSAPSGLPHALLAALDAKLARAAGLASRACLCRVVYEHGAQGHLLGFVDAAPGSEPALTRAVADALGFSGLEAGALDVAFFAADDPMTRRLEQCGLRFDLPQPQKPQRPDPVAPGMDPDRPPRLR